MTKTLALAGLEHRHARSRSAAAGRGRADDNELIILDVADCLEAD